VSGKALGGLKDLLELMAETTAAAAGGVASALEAVLTRSGYLAELESERSIEAQGRIENLQELIGSTRDFDEQVERGDFSGLVAIGGVGVGEHRRPAASPQGSRAQAFFEAISS
jgi:DNA helicase-2/ATP-dependent DNA helicase PcrA